MLWDLLAIIGDALLLVAYVRVYVCIAVGLVLGLLLNGAVGDSTAFLPMTFATIGLVMGVLWHRRSSEPLD